MAFAVLVVFIFAIALRGTPPTRKTYFAIGAAALVTSIWEYFG